MKSSTHIGDIDRQNPAQTLKNKCCNLAKTAVCELLTSLNDDMIIPINQSSKEATYYPQITEKDILIDFTKTAAQINALVRGLTPWQPAYIAHKNTFLKAGKMKFFRNKTSVKKPAVILKKRSSTLWITTGDNKIAKISKVKLFGRFGFLFTPLYMRFCVKKVTLSHRKKVI